MKVYICNAVLEPIEGAWVPDIPLEISPGIPQPIATEGVYKEITSLDLTFWGHGTPATPDGIFVIAVPNAQALVPATDWPHYAIVDMADALQLFTDNPNLAFVMARNLLRGLRLRGEAVDEPPEVP